jgi:hypothetical protein
MPLDPTFAGSNPADGDVFLRVIKIRSTPSFGGREVKLSAPCHTSLHVKEPFKVRTKMLHKYKFIIFFYSSSSLT